MEGDVGLLEAARGSAWYPGSLKMEIFQVFCLLKFWETVGFAEVSEGSVCVARHLASLSQPGPDGLGGNRDPGGRRSLLGCGLHRLPRLGVTLKPSSFSQRGSAWLVQGAGKPALPVHLTAFTFVCLSASPENMPVWEQDVEEQLTALDSLIAQPPAPAAGATEQRALRE